jgi:signal transduction histidine kinase
MQTAKGESAWLETHITSKAEMRIPVRFSGTVLHEKQTMMGSVAFFQDLREIKRLERELLKAERLAAIGQTVAGMAHCIKNILHGFKGGSYLVNVGIDKNNEDKLHNGWQMIQRNITRTSDLVLDLLSYSKEREPEYEICSPNVIADDVCELLKAHATDYEVEIITSYSASIGEFRMDGRTLHRSLMNLVSNAIDACIFDDNPHKQFQVRVTSTLDPVGFVRFEVQDNGCGMSPEVKNKLFTSFFSTKGAKGTGLGLLVTQKLIEEHQGTIEVESQLGQGTTFTIRLPFRAAPAEQKT